jgi:hypothetical protein
VDCLNQTTVPHPDGNVLNKMQAGAITLFTYCDDMGPTLVTPIAWGERGFLPGREHEHWYNPRGFYGDYSDNEKERVANPAKRPCDGRDAYPGGWPGDGGDGG